MQKKDRSQVFNELRNKHPYFIYENFTIEHSNSQLILRFFFNLSDKYHFSSTLCVPVAKKFKLTENEQWLQNLAFHLGMAELVSYWKAACSPKIIIRAALLDAKQIAWWKKLWFQGLGEFFYTNGVQVSEDSFVEVSCETDTVFTVFSFDSNSKILVPIGGGKDSVVTLELLSRNGFSVAPFILNPRRASLQTIKSAGFARSALFEIQRTIDPQLIKLNEAGYLNGHTPFSAMLAFVTLLAARLKNIRHIALSNESSANEVSIPGTHVNHQYSKSIGFEKDFRDYVAKYISADFNYFSFLRPVNELQIGKLFSDFSNHHKTFRSCNVGSKTDVWCGHCPKCLFTWIILSPFITQEKLSAIFGKDILNDSNLIQTLKELSGIADEKPLECVGTVDEVNAALKDLIQNLDTDQLPKLLEFYKNQNVAAKIPSSQLLKQFDAAHFLQPGFEQILKQAL